MNNNTDFAFMRIALTLARRGLGRVAPNPSVGCVLVRPDLNDRIVGRGWTQPGGRPHAETEALSQAGMLAKGATAYVTLEPCSHTGETGPCADALVKAGIRRCVIAIEDPDDRVAGRGLERLRAASIDVEVGILAAEARRLNAGFLSHRQNSRPWVTLKLATSLDGAIATASGKSKWITGPKARARGHLLRAENDAIMTGIGTVLADNPELTCRLPGLLDRSPDRIVIDREAKMSQDIKLIQTAAQFPVLHITGDKREVKIGALGYRHATLPLVSNKSFSMNDILSLLGKKGYTRILIEGGQGLSTAFLEQGAVDEIAWFRSASVMGADGLSAIGNLGVEAPSQMQVFRRKSTCALDDDVLERYVRDID